MPYVTSVDRIGEARALERGKRQAVLQVAQARFGSVPETLERQLAAADATELDALLERVARAASVDEL